MEDLPATDHFLFTSVEEKKVKVRDAPEQEKAYPINHSSHVFIHNIAINKNEEETEIQDQILILILSDLISYKFLF